MYHFEPVRVIYATLIESEVEPLKLIVNIISYVIHPWTAIGTLCQQENKYDDCLFSKQNIHICVQFNTMATLQGTEDMVLTIPKIMYLRTNSNMFLWASKLLFFCVPSCNV